MLADGCLFDDAVWPDFPEQDRPRPATSPRRRMSATRTSKALGLLSREGVAPSCQDSAAGIEAKRPVVVDIAGTHSYPEGSMMLP